MVQLFHKLMTLFREVKLLLKCRDIFCFSLFRTLRAVGGVSPPRELQGAEEKHGFVGSHECFQASQSIPQFLFQQVVNATLV